MATTLGNQSYAWWVGADGNIWANIGGVGVRKLGGSVNPDGSATIMSYGDANMPSDYLQANQRIADPVSRTGGGAVLGASTEAPKVVNTAAVGATQQAIDSLGTEQATGNQNIDDSFGSVVGQYDRENQQNEGDYTDQTTTNNKNLDRNRQNAMVAAAQGRRGLRGTLSAIGALSGTGGELADRVVTTGANQDIGEATDTAATNAQALDKAIGRYREEDKNRRAQAETARTNQRTSLEGSIAAKRQQFYQKMADLFNEGGDTGNAAKYLGLAGGLNNEIASKTRVAATPITAQSAAFTPGTLESYLAGAGDMTVKVAGGGNGTGIPTILAGGRDPAKKKDREDAVAAAAA